MMSMERFGDPCPGIYPAPARLSLSLPAPALSSSGASRLRSLTQSTHREIPSVNSQMTHINHLDKIQMSCKEY